MGYTTDFEGAFKFNRTLTREENMFLNKLGTTRRMARKKPPEYGVEGELFVDGTGFAGQDRDESIIDYNRPPITQPSLWCQWVPTIGGNYLVWDGNEKFYEYVDWLKYIIKSFLNPNDITLTGVITWGGEDRNDIGTIIVEENKVKVVKGERIKPTHLPETNRILNY